MLTNLSKVKTWLQIPQEEVREDVLLTNLILSKSKAVENYLSREILAKDYNIDVSGTDSNFIVLPNFPIISISSVLVNEKPLSLSDIKFDKKKIYLKNGFFEKGFMNVNVSFRAGYEVVPEDLEQCVIEIVGEAYKEKDKIGQDIKSILDGTEKLSYSHMQINPSIKMMLNPYKRVAIV